MTTTTDPFSARFLEAEDVPAILAIERAGTPFPWSEGIFRDCLRVGFVCRVMVHENEVIAFGILSHGAGEGHVLNLGVKPSFQRRGIGRTLLRLLIDDARQLSLSTVYLEVRSSNVKATALYESEGFNEIGVRRDYYPVVNGREDALIFALAIGDSF